VYGCASAGVTWVFIFMTVVLHSAAVGGAKEQKLYQIIYFLMQTLFEAIWDLTLDFRQN